jgi:hypothetical protein
MSFLAPLFFLGVTAVGLPILFHLIRRTTRDRKPFSSLMFLAPSPPRLTQRSRLENLLLLFLRCLAIALLTFGFARPFLKKAVATPGNAAAKRVLVLVDTSASMRRAGLWADARKQVEKILKDCAPADQVSLFTFDRQVVPRFTFEQWNTSPMGDRGALLLKRFSELSPGWGSTALGNALIQAAEAFNESGPRATLGPARIELITDLQEGSHLDPLQGYEWPKSVEVAVTALKARSNNNASLQLVSDSDDSEPVKAATSARIRVSNSAGSKREQFKVGWAQPDGTSFVGQPLAVYVPAGQTRVLALPTLATGASDRISLQGDDEPFDNLVFAKTSGALRLNVAYIGTDAPGNPKQPLYFLKRAFQETRRETVNVQAFSPNDALPPDQAEATRLFIVTAPLSQQSGEAIRRQVQAGKTLLLVPGSTSMTPCLRELLQSQTLELTPVRPGNYAMLSDIDFRHPLFAPFADPRFSDFTKIHFWSYLKLDPSTIPGSRVLARFDTGDPALLELPVATGRVLILSSGWTPETSQLALSSKFVPLMYSILETSGGPAPAPPQFKVGDKVSIESLAGTRSAGVSVELPDGSRQALAEHQAVFSATEVPGVYSVSGAGWTRSFVVNLDPSESRTVPVAIDELERFGVPTSRLPNMEMTEAQRKVRLQSAELENRQKLWRWFITGTMLVLLFETWLAGRTGRRAMAPASLAAT